MEENAIIMQSKSELLIVITYKHNDSFYCLNCLHSFATEKKLESHKKLCENKHFSNVIMSSKDRI